MLVGRLHTYLACSSKGLVQKHLVSYFDPLPLEPAAEEDLQKCGYSLELMDNGLYCLIHPEKGYLTLSPDPSMLEHLESPVDNSYVRDIDPAILPPPPPPVKPQTSIAKYIHQTGYHEEIPEDFIPNKEALISLNPEYEYIYWHDAGEDTCADFIKKYYGDTVLSYYNSINPKYGAAKGDFFRYLCIYILGGVYLDLKTTVTVPLECIIEPDDLFLLSFAPWNWHWSPDIRYIKYGCEYQQYMIMCAAGHPLMKRIIHQTLCAIKLYVPEIHGTGQPGVFTTTGPILYSRIINSFRTSQTTRLFSAITAGVDYSIFSAREHYHKLGDTHYSQQNTPVILNPESL